LTAPAQDPILNRLGQAAGQQRVSRAFTWTTASGLAQQIAQFGSSIVLARLLLPSDYGLIAVVGSAMVFAALFTDLGLGAAVIHREVPTRSFLSTVFWINAVAGVALTLITGGVGYLLASVYGEPQLRGLMWIGGLTFALDLRVVQTTLLSRTMRFRQLALIEAASAAIGIATSITAAELGAGASSLVLGPVSTTISASLGLWIAVGWQPALVFSRAEAREAVRFGRGLVGFNFVNYWSRNADNILLARTTSAAQLGLYSRAYALMMAPLAQVTTMAGRVLFPVLARARARPREAGELWVRATKLLLVGVAPIALAFATAAPALVATLYGARWHGAARLLELLSTAGLLQLLPAASGQVYYAFGATDELFRRGLISSALTVMAIVAGLPWGTVGVAVGVLVKSVLLFWYPLVGACRLTEMTLGELLDGMSGLALSSLAFAAASLGVRFAVGHQMADGLLLVTQSAAGMVAMQLTLGVADRPLLVESWGYLRRGISLATNRRRRAPAAAVTDSAPSDT
jgi:PST family polysaccharide transporter